ncbi:MAG: carbohydrate-binding protein, partial [Bacteroidales bacterium]
PTADEAYAAVMQFAENHRIENCIIQYDVIDAMFRQPYTTDIKPFRKYSVEDYIFATDYALGRNGFAYFDNDTADYHGDTDEFTAWNQGYSYRNDGVDIEACSDTDTTNGFNVGWIESGEWLVYPIENDEEALVDVNFRYASGSGGGNVVIEINGKVASNPVNLTGTGGWQNWSSATATDILIPAGNFNLKLRFPDGGFNLNYFRFENFRDPQAATFKVLYAETSETKNEIFIHLNKSISSWDVQEGDFKLEINNGDANITDISYEPGGEVIKINTDKLIYPGRLIIVSYTGSGIQSESGPLDPFTDLQVDNQMARFFNLPVKIQAEYFYVNNGFVLEDCQDIGFGQNTGYADPGDYLDYLIYVPEPGLYKIESRVALQGGNALLYFSYSDDEELSGEKFTSYSSTGGWQSWQTQETTMELPAGKFRFRIRSHTGAFNLNWFEFSLVTGIENEEEKPNISFYPNPVSDILTINFDNPSSEPRHISIYNSLGLKLYSNHTFDQDYRIDTRHFHPGLYFLVVGDGDLNEGFRFLKQ